MTAAYPAQRDHAAALRRRLPELDRRPRAYPSQRQHAAALRLRIAEGLVDRREAAIVDLSARLEVVPSELQAAA